MFASAIDDALGSVGMQLKRCKKCKAMAELSNPILNDICRRCDNKDGGKAQRAENKKRGDGCKGCGSMTFTDGAIFPGQFCLS